MATAWWYVLGAGLLEVFWVVGLRATDGFSRLVPSVLVGAAIVGSMYLLSMASRSLAPGTAYAVWVGIGIGGTAIAEAAIARELPSLLRLAFLAMLLGAIIGLRITETPPAAAEQGALDPSLPAPGTTCTDDIC